MNDRSERREEIKLKLEYAKIVFSLAGIATIVFAGLQWRAANQVANEAVYQRIATEWRDHLKTFVEKPQLRPYFESKKELSSDDPNAQAVLALADVRLDVEDAILTYADFRGQADAIVGWRNTFASSFKTSPVLCARLKETSSNYGLIVPIGNQVCSLDQEGDR
jgi:hypothetical protein